MYMDDARRGEEKQTPLPSIPKITPMSKTNPADLSRRLLHKVLQNKR